MILRRNLPTICYYFLFDGGWKDGSRSAKQVGNEISGETAALDKFRIKERRLTGRVGKVRGLGDVNDVAISSSNFSVSFPSVENCVIAGSKAVFDISKRSGVSLVPYKRSGPDGPSIKFKRHEKIVEPSYVTENVDVSIGFGDAVREAGELCADLHKRFIAVIIVVRMDIEHLLLVNVNSVRRICYDYVKEVVEFRADVVAGTESELVRDR